MKCLADRAKALPPIRANSKRNIALSAAMLTEAKLEAPADQRPILGGRRGHHSEHLGHLLAVMQFLPRALSRRAWWWVMAEHFHGLRVAEIVPRPRKPIRSGSSAGRAQRCFPVQGGQHLSVRADIGGEEVRRNYSLCVAPDEAQLKVTVKRIAGGVFSNWVGDNLKAGDMLDVMTPHGWFTIDFDPRRSRRYVGFAGGSGSPRSCR